MTSRVEMDGGRRPGGRTGSACLRAGRTSSCRPDWNFAEPACHGTFTSESTERDIFTTESTEDTENGFCRPRLKNDRGSADDAAVAVIAVPVQPPKGGPLSTPSCTGRSTDIRSRSRSPNDSTSSSAFEAAATGRGHFYFSATPGTASVDNRNPFSVLSVSSVVN